MVVGEIAQEKEVVIIGGGPGGYTAAIRAAQLGKEVLLIEQKKLGGVCLNEGCIPSKTFVHAAKQASKLEHISILGYQIENNRFDYSSFLTYKNQVVTQLGAGVASLCKANKIEIMYGRATFISENKIGIENGHHYEVVNFEQAIIATGAKADSKKILPNYQLDRLQLFNLDKLPDQLILVGSDYIILEAAFAYSLLGTKVSIILQKNNEFEYDLDIVKEVKRQLKKNKITLYTEIEKLHFDEAENGVECSFINQKGEANKIYANAFYMSESLMGNTESLGLERIGIMVDEHQFIICDKQGRTNLNHIFAIGDVTGEPFYAVKSMKQGKVAAEMISGGINEVDLTWMPKVVHSIPPIASVGYTEEEAKIAGFSTKTGQYQLPGNGYALLTGNRDGFVKAIIDEQTNRLIGIHIIGEGAIELISTAIIGGEMVARDEDFLFPTYPHPSINEALLEAMEDTVGLSIHQVAKKKKRKEKTTIQ
ncbi:dihydrolipoyl dehydrogenase family protein [Heyndrickxia sporothermodurans]